VKAAKSLPAKASSKPVDRPKKKPMLARSLRMMLLAREESYMRVYPGVRTLAPRSSMLGLKTPGFIADGKAGIQKDLVKMLLSRSNRRQRI
jgi:hypothetical protein